MEQVRERADGYLHLQTRVLPVTWQGVREQVPGLLASRGDFAPSALILTGEYDRGWGLRLETTARNRQHSIQPDNAGQVREEEPVIADAAPALMTVVPAEQWAAELTALGVPAFVSQDAGTYICNQSYYLALHNAPPGLPVLFVHIPRELEPAPEGFPAPGPGNLAGGMLHLISWMAGLGE
ncbi:MAG: Pyrrolidone-carboxylate peptidase [Myxococcota bacterium]|nr:Pyrrolidone-carboxylate peptidase [Myxococcota bacterium]